MGSLEQTIALLGSNNNDQRRQAEEIVNNLIETQPEQFTFECLRLLADSQDATVRTLTCILYRRTCFNKYDDNKSAWLKLSEATHQAVKQRLLQALTTEPVEHVRKTICDTVSDTAEFLLSKQTPWTDLPNFLFQQCQSPQPEHHAAALEIFASLPTMFDDATRQRHSAVIKDVFVRAISQENIKVALAGLKALVAFILILTRSERQQFYSTLPLMIEILNRAINTKEDNNIQVVIAVLLDLADRTPGFFERNLTQIVPVMVNLVNTRTQNMYENSTAQVALEFVLVLAENKPEMILKYRDYVSLVFPACLSLMIDVDEDEKWFSVDELEDIEMDANDTVGEQGLDRLACALKGPTVLPVALPLVVQMLSNPSWQHRHAGLLALGAIAEGCHDELFEQLPSIVPEIVKFAADPYPRVRHALCNCLGQFCLDFKPDIQEQFATIILPAIVQMTEDASLPRIQSHAAAALVNFADETPRYILQPYLDILLIKLLALLQSVRKRYAIEQTMDAIATIADAAGDLFRTYYNMFVPLLKNILMQPIQENTRVMRAKAMECLTLIGIAVGKEVFMQDARELMELLLQTYGHQPLPSDDPQASYLLSAYGRIGTTLKEDFVPYLHRVMPALSHSAKIKPDVQLIHDDDDDDTLANEWDIIEFEDKKMGIKTSMVEEKLTAVEMLYCFARELGASFAEYAPDVLDLMIDLFKFYFDDSIRVIAMSSVGPLFECLKLAHADNNYIHGKWRTAVDRYLTVMHDEPVVEMLTRILEGFRTAITAMGDSCLSDDEIRRFTDFFATTLAASIKRSDKRHAQRVSRRNDDDADMMEDAEEEEASMLKELSDLLHVVYKTQSQRFTPFFHPYAEHLAVLIHPADSRAPMQRVLALCAFSDVIEFAGPATMSYVPLFLNGSMAAINDAHPAVRQAACYGVGVMAQFGGPTFAKPCAESLQRLLSVIQHPEARDEENTYATENAISAIGKICQYNNTAFDVNQVLPLWLNALPVVDDTEEASATYSFLCALVESNNPVVLGQENANLPKIVQAMAMAISSDALDDDLDTRTRVLRILKQIHHQVPPEMRAMLWAGVDAGSQEIVLPLLQ